MSLLAGLAQLAERSPCKRKVIGSSPVFSSIINKKGISMIRAEAIAIIVKNRDYFRVWQYASAWNEYFLLFEGYLLHAHLGNGVRRRTDTSNSNRV